MSLTVTANFDLKQTILKVLDQILPKVVFLFQNTKSEHHYRIQHIRIRKETKFLLRQTVFVFLAKCAREWYRMLTHRQPNKYSLKLTLSCPNIPYFFTYYKLYLLKTTKSLVLDRLATYCFNITLGVGRRDANVLRFHIYFDKCFFNPKQ